jgi:hypothetical protein
VWGKAWEKERGKKIKKLITIWVSGIIKTPPLNPFLPKTKLIQVTRMTTKHARKGLLSQLEGCFPRFSIRVEGRLSIGW